MASKLQYSVALIRIKTVLILLAKKKQQQKKASKIGKYSSCIYLFYETVSYFL